MTEAENAIKGIPKRLDKWFWEKKLKPADVSKETNIPNGSLSRILNHSSNNPGSRSFIILALKYGLDLNHIFLGKKMSSPMPKTEEKKPPDISAAKATQIIDNLSVSLARLTAENEQLRRRLEARQLQNNVLHSDLSSGDARKSLTSS